jgi:hypothetical protein
MQTRSAAAALGVLLAAVPASEAAAQTAAPTLQFDRACYTSTWTRPLPAPATRPAAR